MIYAPHILQKMVITGGELVDGNPVAGTEEWVDVSHCRCDDNDAKERVSVNGILHDYNYHVVYEGEKLSIGTGVRVIDKDGSIRGKGLVIKPKVCNYFAPKAEIWM